MVNSFQRKDKYTGRLFTINPSDYELEIETETSNKYFAMIFEKSLNVSKPRTNDIAKEAFEESNEIRVNEKFYKLINANIGSIMKQERKNAAEKGLRIMSNSVAEVIFKRDPKNKEQWFLFILIKGQYMQM